MMGAAPNASPAARRPIATTSAPATANFALRVPLSLIRFIIRTNTRMGLTMRGCVEDSAGGRNAVSVKDPVHVPKPRDALLELLGVTDLEHEAVLHHRVLGGAARLKDVQARLRECAR